MRAYIHLPVEILVLRAAADPAAVDAADLVSLDPAFDPGRTAAAEEDTDAEAEAGHQGQTDEAEPFERSTRMRLQ